MIRSNNLIGVYHNTMNSTLWPKEFLFVSVRKAIGWELGGSGISEEWPEMQCARISFLLIYFNHETRGKIRILYEGSSDESLR